MRCLWESNDSKRGESQSQAERGESQRASRPIHISGHSLRTRPQPSDEQAACAHQVRTAPGISLRVFSDSHSHVIQVTR